MPTTVMRRDAALMVHPNPNWARPSGFFYNARCSGTTGDGFHVFKSQPIDEIGPALQLWPVRRWIRTFTPSLEARCSWRRPSTRNTPDRIELLNTISARRPRDVPIRGLISSASRRRSGTCRSNGLWKMEFFSVFNFTGKKKNASRGFTYTTRRLGR